MRPNPFAEPGQWYRGNTHSHSTGSDGRLSVPDLCQSYEDKGYDFIAVTDHLVVTDVSQNRSSKLIALPGSEIPVCWDEAHGGAEICSIGIERVKRNYAHPQDVIDDVRAQGGVPILSHPSVSGVYSQLIMTLDGLVGIEILNAKMHYSGRRGLAVAHWEDVLSDGKEIWGIASDDRHTGNEQDTHDFAKGWIHVKAADRSATAILDAIRGGMFYSSTGPQIQNIKIEDGHIHVATSPVKAITLSSIPTKGARQVAQGDEKLTAATFRLNQVGTREQSEAMVARFIVAGHFTQPKTIGAYFRVEAWDGAEGYAWSNPVFF